MDISKIVKDVLLRAYKIAKDNKDEFVTPEHLLLSALEEDMFKNAIIKLNGDVAKLQEDLINYIDENIEKLELNDPEESYGIKNILIIATQQATFGTRNLVALEHIISAMYSLKDNYGISYLNKQGINKSELLFELANNKEEENNVAKDAIKIFRANSIDGNKSIEKKNEINKYCEILTDLEVEEKDPLIGRKDIIDRTIQILCRRTKNNPVHVGEPGVGKTAITMGLAELIKKGMVPDKLKNSKIFSLDIGAMLAGTKYRGDFEERVKQVLDEIKAYENPIVYIDEIHNIVGAGALNGSSIDGGSLIKSYLLDGKIKFIGATTYEDYKKYFEKDKALIRRFQMVDVKETTEEETIKIIMGLKENFESYHKVKYDEEAIKEAVKLSSKYINDRFLPDKAIDIIDEAGAYLDINRTSSEDNVVTKKIVEEIIAGICNIPKETVETTELESLKDLEKNLKKKIFGQDNAIEEVTKAIKLSRAGLN